MILDRIGTGIGSLADNDGRTRRSAQESGSTGRAAWPVEREPSRSVIWRLSGNTENSNLKTLAWMSTYARRATGYTA